MVDSCMGEKRNTQDIICGGLWKDTTCYSWLTVVWVTKKYTTYKLWGSEERYYVLFMVDSCMGDKRNTQDINCGGEKDTTCYSLLTVVWETKEIHKI